MVINILIIITALVKRLFRENTRLLNRQLVVFFVFIKIRGICLPKDNTNNRVPPNRKWSVKFDILCNPLSSSRTLFSICYVLVCTDKYFSVVVLPSNAQHGRLFMLHKRVHQIQHFVPGTELLTIFVVFAFVLILISISVCCVLFLQLLN